MSKRDQKKHQKEVKRKKQLQERAARQQVAVYVPPREIRNALMISHQMMSDRNYEEAEEILLSERRRRPSSPEILEALIDLYQRTRNHAALAKLTPELVRLQPRDPQSFAMMAQSYLFCGRCALALETYQKFLEQWPNHQLVSKAEAAIELLQEALARELPTCDLTESEVHLLSMHDRIVLKISDQDFAAAVALAKELLVIKPQMVSARNNLALCLFQTNQMSDALQIARETVQMFPENRFAQALLGKTLFLLGEMDDADRIADQVAESFATQQDALAAQAEFLSFMGRDDAVVRLVEYSDTLREIVPPCRGLLYHYKAVAMMRMGQEEAARDSWKRCLKDFPGCSPARQNLDELKREKGSHAPWAEPFAKWIPALVLKDIAKTLSLNFSDSRSPMAKVLKEWSHLPRLVPALLDRGDQFAREFALLVARLFPTAELYEALKTFATGQRGPDSMRMSALSFLREQKQIRSEAVRFWSNGAWTDLVTFSADVNFEPVPHPNEMVNRLINSGINAMHRDDLQRAEDAFRKCIEIDPDFPTAWHNLAGVQFRKRDQSSEEEAKRILQDLFQRFPDYPFARTSLAQQAIFENRLDDAQELLKPLASRPQWHVSELMAYGTALVELALAMKDISRAEASLEMLRELDEEAPCVEQLRSLIERQKNPMSSLGDRFVKMLHTLKQGSS